MREALGLNIFYFITLSGLLYFVYEAVVFDFSPEYMELLDNTTPWQWSDFPTPRFWRNVNIIIASVIFHATVHFVARCSFRLLLPSYYKMPFETRVTLSEKILSSIHGFVLGTAGLNLVFVKWVWSEDIFGQYPVILDYVFCFSCGYELYDLGTMVMQDIKTRGYNENVFWVHHSSMLIGYTLVMIKLKFTFVAAMLLITELTVLPSNIHWYLKAFGYRDTRAFHFNQGLRLWAFIVLRLFTAPIIFIAFCRNWEQFWYEEDNLVKIAAVVITGLLGVMNVNWTRAMLILYRKRTRLRDKRAAKLVAAQQTKQE